MEACRDAALQFFDRSIEEKGKVQQLNSRSPYGYSPMAQEALARSRGDNTPPDLKESFSIGPLTHSPQPINRDEAIFAATPNRWPDSPKNFRTSLEAYYKAMNNVADILMRRFAVALVVQFLVACRSNFAPQQVAPPSLGSLDVPVVN